MIDIKISRMAFVIFALSLLIFFIAAGEGKAQTSPGPVLKWRTSVGYPGRITVAGGIVYAATPTGCTDYVPCGPPARLTALDGQTGQVKWMRENLGDGIAPKVMNDILYLSGGNFYALDAKNGAEIWKFEGGNGGPPIVTTTTGFVWSVARGSLLSLLSYSSGGNLFAVDLKTGKEKWKYQLKDDGPRQTELIDQSIVFLTSSNIYLKKSAAGPSLGIFALNAKTGKLKWSRQINGGGGLIAGMSIYYITPDNFLHSTTLRNGQDKWKRKLPGKINYPVAAFLDMIFLKSENQELRAVDLKTGNQKWKVENFYPNILTIDAAKGIVVFPSIGYLYALDINTGAEKWKFKLDGAAGVPVIDGSTLYVMASLQKDGFIDGFVYALELP